MAFLSRREDEDGAPVEPHTLKTATPNWRNGDTIPVGRGRTLHVVDVRDDDADQPAALVVREATRTTLSA